MNKELAEKLRYLHLSGLSAHWDEYLQEAAHQKASQTWLLTHVVEEEYRLKCDKARKLRLARARIPEPWVLETFPFDRQPKLNKKAILALYESLSFMTQKQNIIWLGATGCGKTGLATSFLTHAIHQGYSGRHVLFADLITQLYQAIADHSQAKVLKHYQSFDLLHVD